MWAPFSKAEYDALPRWRRALEHVYRSVPGVGLYYACEIWWRRLWLAAGPPGIGAIARCARATASRSPRRRCASAGTRGWLRVLLPFVCWNWLMGWAIFEHHTHPDVPWFDDEAAWRAAGAQVACTVHIVLPASADTMLHFIMQHTAHHLDVTIPLYELRDAQHVVEQAGARVVSLPLDARHVPPPSADLQALRFRAPLLGGSTRTVNRRQRGSRPRLDTLAPGMLKS